MSRCNRQSAALARCCFAPACSACFDRAMWIATAIGSDHNPIKTRLLLVKPVAPNQRDSEKGVASPTGFEPGRDQQNPRIFPAESGSKWPCLVQIGHRCPI